VVASTSAKPSEPHNLDAERSVLGSCLLHPDAVPEVAAILTPADFYLPRHEVIFRAILASHANKRACDPIVVGEELNRRDLLQEAGGHELLFDLMECVVTASGVEYHAEIVREHAQRRRLRDLARDIDQRVANDESPVEIANAIEHRLDELAVRATAPTGVVPKDILAGWAVEGPLVHLAIGLPRIDEMTGGGPPFGSRCYLVGAPDAGKTALAVQIADRFLARDILVGFLAIDEEPGDILMRFLQRRGFARWQCEQRDKAILESMAATIADAGLTVYGEEHTIQSAARDLAARARKEGKRAALFIDSVQTARCEKEPEDASMHVAVTARVRAIRAVTTANRFVTYVTSEMGRAYYRTLDGAERISDMAAAKESGAIEYSARFMVSLRSVPRESDLVEVRITKNKFGPRTREEESGIHLRLDRASQELTEDTTYVGKGAAETEEQRAEERSQLAIEDAAVVALVIVDEPGIAKSDAEDEFMRRARCGTRRWKAAWSVLRRSIVEVPAPRNRLSLYLDGAKVPPEVMTQVPFSERPRVAASDPKAELHRAAPSSTGDGGATQRELHHHPLRSRGGAARRCRRKKRRAAPEEGGAARDGDGA
jgi:replicative DNA helicase